MSALDLNNAEVKAAVDAIVKAAVEEATTGLQNKNSELLGKLAKAKKGQEIDPADFQALQKEVETLEGQLVEANKTLKAAIKDAETFKKSYETENAFVNKLMIDNGLTESIIKAGVRPELAKAVKSMLAGQVTLKIDGDKREAIVGDKPLSEFVDQWAKSDEGKHFVSAPDNKGGGAAGGGGEATPEGLAKIVDPAQRLSAINQQAGKK